MCKYSPKVIFKEVHISIICNSPIFEKPKCSSIMDLKNYIFSYNRILNINESGVIIATGNNTDEYHKHNS